MIGWSAVGRIVLLAAIIGGAAYWLHGTWSASGYRDGYREGYAAALRLADKEALALASQIRADAAEQARAREHDYREIERRQRAEIEAGRLDAEARAAAARRDRDRLLGRLRDAEGRAARAVSQLPETTGPELARTVPAGPLYDAILDIGRGLREAAGRSGDAEELNVRYGQCLRYARSITSMD